MGKTSQREVWVWSLSKKNKITFTAETVPARTKHDRIVQKEKGIWKLPWEQNILRKLLHSKNSPFLMEKGGGSLCNNKHAKQSTGKYSLRM